ncbi:hypothetical protein DL765_005584 [Monosporascus sp. GIB2]|nr:hypothetical protein DL765_005584 [Monosporascus sp. GIB2]
MAPAEASQSSDSSPAANRGHRRAENGCRPDEAPCAQKQAADYHDCAASPDHGGIGVRIAFYLQIMSTFLISTDKFEIPKTLTVNLWFEFALFITLIYTTAAGQVNDVEAYICIYLLDALSILGSVVYRILSWTSEYSFASVSAHTALKSAILGYAVWFWWVGVFALHQRPSQEGGDAGGESLPSLQNVASRRSSSISEIMPATPALVAAHNDDEPYTSKCEVMTTHIGSAEDCASVASGDQQWRSRSRSPVKKKKRKSISEFCKFMVFICSVSSLCGVASLLTPERTSLLPLVS